MLLADLVTRTRPAAWPSWPQACSRSSPSCSSPCEVERPRAATSESAGISAAVAAAEASLGADGRILVRPSGTEPVVRVMVEADDEHEAQRITDELVGSRDRRAGRVGRDEVLRVT